VHMSPEVLEDKARVLNTVSRRTDAEVIFGEDLTVLEL